MSIHSLSFFEPHAVRPRPHPPRPITPAPASPIAQASPTRTHVQVVPLVGGSVSSNNLKNTNLVFGAFQISAGAAAIYRWLENRANVSLSGRVNFPTNTWIPSWTIALGAQYQIPLSGPWNLLIGARLYLNAFNPRSTVTPRLGRGYKASADVLDFGLDGVVGLRLALGGAGNRSFQATVSAGPVSSNINANAQVLPNGSIEGGVIVGDDRFPTDIHTSAPGVRISANLGSNCLVPVGLGCFGFTLDASYEYARYVFRHNWTTGSGAEASAYLNRWNLGGAITYQVNLPF